MLRKYLIESMTQYELAHKTAQRNAALPIEQGGLGLHPNNTALERARAMGYTTKAYHGTSHNFTGFDNKHIGKHFGDTAGHFFTSSTTHMFSPKTTHEDMYSAGAYAKHSAELSGNPPHILPVLLKMKHPKIISDDSDGAGVLSLVERGNYTAGEYFDDHVIKHGHDSMVVSDTGSETDLPNGLIRNPDTYINRNKYDEIYAVQNPHQIRSIHAAFDPMRQHESDLLA